MPVRNIVLRRIASEAGCVYVNGPYQYGAGVTEDGYPQPSSEICYTWTIPEGEDGTGRKLTLFRCTMRPQQKWWFLSKAQPGTDRDIDY
jgi:hypothetical protein